MALNVLSVAHPLAAVGDDAVGGAEQVLHALDRALVRAGHRSTVIAAHGSKVAGELVALSPTPEPYDTAATRLAHEHARAAIATALRRRQVDIIHIHALQFDELLPDTDIPILVTLHLPREFYSSEILRRPRANTWFNCVSEAQHRSMVESGPRWLPPIENGVTVADSLSSGERGDFVLVLSRICWEKGIHVAIDAARAAGVPLLIGGAVFPYPEHQRYFREQIRPKLGSECRFLGIVQGGMKQHLLSRARCVLVPSLVAETSSLVAREALAQGTPVVAFDRGALRDTIVDGETGFLAQDFAGLVRGIESSVELNRAACLETAQRRFSLDGMVGGYLSVYDDLTRLHAHSEAGRVSSHVG